MSGQLSSAIATAADAGYERAQDISRFLHENPELGFHEEKAVAMLTEWLSDAGFTIETGIAGMPTAFTAIVGGESAGPTVAYLAEYDALAGLGHGCGHNLIAAGSCLAAISLHEAIGDSAGRIMVIGTPAEEGGGGKVMELEAGIFDGVDAALMFHGADRTIVSRPMLASMRYEVLFRGTAAHAAKNPDAGRSALSAAQLLFHAVDAMRTHLSSSARLNGIITSGGQAVNIIPERCEVVFQVREHTLDAARQLGLWFEKSCQAAAIMTQTTVSVTRPSPDYAHLVSNPVLAGRCVDYLNEAGLTVESAAPDEATASTDAGNVSLRIPTLHPFIQVAPRGTASHSTAMLEAVAQPAAQAAMLVGAKVLAQLGMDVLLDDAFRREMVDAFLT
ncbi:MAG: amidohydrolase [Microbacteriaceae bacterium]|nr:amidohydrolase [Microbacteriaceae bacterium]